MLTNTYLLAHLASSVLKYYCQLQPQIVFEQIFVILKARKLEAQLDDQLNAYRKSASMKSDDSENHVESDIERSLKQLQQVNSQMQAWVSSGGSELLSHTLTRHMEILQDLSQVTAFSCTCLVLSSF